MAILIGALHVNSVFATALTFILLWVFVGVQRKDLMLPGLVTGMMYAGIAITIYGIFLNGWIPIDYLESTWLLSNSSLGITILGNVPLSEIVWFFGIGCFLSIFELFVNKREYMPFRPALHK